MTLTVTLRERWAAKMRRSHSRHIVTLANSQQQRRFLPYYARTRDKILHKLCCGGGAAAGNHPRVCLKSCSTLWCRGWQRGRNLLNNARYAHNSGGGSIKHVICETRRLIPAAAVLCVRRLAINFRRTVNLISCPTERSASAVINFARDACGNAFI